MTKSFAGIMQLENEFFLQYEPWIRSEISKIGSVRVFRYPWAHMYFKNCMFNAIKKKCMVLKYIFGQHLRYDEKW